MSNYKDGRLWKENRHLLSEEMVESLQNVRPLNLQWTGYTFAPNMHILIVDGRSNDVYIETTS